MSKIILLSFAILLAISRSCAPGNGSKSSTQADPGVLDLFPEPSRPAGQSDVIELRCDPIDTVRIGFIGLGMRGYGAVYRYTFLENIEIKALCDVVSEKVGKCQVLLKEKGLPSADGYTGADYWKEMRRKNSGKIQNLPQQIMPKAI